MPIGRIVDTDSDGTPTTGTIHNNAWLQSIFDKIDAFIVDPTVWTPTIGGSTSQSGQAYSMQFGRYVNHNKQILAYGQIVLTTLGTVTGNVQIKGLPLTSKNTAGFNGVVLCPVFSNMTTSMASLSGYIVPNTTAITLQYVPAAGSVATSNLAQAQLSNTTVIIFAALYESNT